MSRADQRSAREIRPTHIVAGCLSNCTSSSCVEIGTSRVLCCLRGPQQLTSEHRGTRGRIVCNVLKEPYATARRQPQTFRNQIADKEIDTILEGVAEQLVILESIPQLQYEMTFDVVSSEGDDDLPALTAAMSVALMEAGVEMRDLATACGAALRDDGTILLDPTVPEGKGSLSYVLVIASSSTGTILYCNQRGGAEAMVAMDLFDVAVAGCLARRGGLLLQS